MERGWRRGREGRGEEASDLLTWTERGWNGEENVSCVIVICSMQTVFPFKDNVPPPTVALHKHPCRDTDQLG